VKSYACMTCLLCRAPSLSAGPYPEMQTLRSTHSQRATHNGRNPWHSSASHLFRPTPSIVPRSPGSRHPEREATANRFSLQPIVVSIQSPEPADSLTRTVRVLHPRRTSRTRRQRCSARPEDPRPNNSPARSPTSAVCFHPFTEFRRPLFEALRNSHQLTST